MTSFGLQSIAQVPVERALNALPEGLLVALFAWLLLRLIGRQNSGTRFAVWFSALLTVVGLSFFGGFKLEAAQAILPPNHLASRIVVPTVWAGIIFITWVLFACIALARIAVGLWQVWRISKGCIEIDLSQLAPPLAEIFLQHSAGRRVRLGVSERLKVPAAIGFWKPLIVLPTWTLQELSPNELEPVLIHELTHLNRRDDWTNLLQKLTRAIFFFHPAVWWIDARLSIEREMACDDAVLASCRNPQAYAGCLIDLLEKSCARRGWTMVQAAVHRAQDLSHRIAQILDAKRPASTRVWKPALALTGVLSLSCFGLSYCTPRLVAFAPSTHIAKAYTAPRMTEHDLAGIQGMVVPASYRLPVPATNSGHASSTTAKTAKHRNLAKHLARSQRQSLMATAVEPQITADRLPVQMVMFVETTTVRYPQQPANNKTTQSKAAQRKTQIWQVVLMVPACYAAQMDGTGSMI
ncbi:M56 family metallopeptidase [Alloacidobacterium sp.]|uniref:M56 family metallopeptidase n=1 Tax=Alloacidobacterium sp. TaxID=2951999 RepID=UPI002D31B29B|nr:M56 family metallopeptidase [Alloacidobacterium sp.]HYK36088.1 M56 family metallopeptidase [Alloacidobacterium sp.]